jgi:hypothetical protein
MSQGYPITIFKSISATSTPYFKDVTVALERIKTGRDLVLINQIRLEKDKAQRNLLKKQLPSICFSGKFRQRHDSGIIKHSGLICLDFDTFKDEEELLSYRKDFLENPEKSKYTFALFTSPSGDGLKVLVRIPPSIADHRNYFKALQEFYNDDHFDKSCINISRVCYSSYDENLYFNPDSEEWVTMEQDEQYDLSIDAPVLKLKSEITIVQNLQKWFDNKFTMNVGEKNNNLFKLASAFNDFGMTRHSCENYLQNKYGSKKTEKEISAIVKSAYKKEGGTKFFEDKQALGLLERQIKSGLDKEKIYKKLYDEGEHTEDDVDAAIKKISETMPVSEFWYYDSKGVCKIRHHKFKAFLEQQGFYKLYPEGAENFVFVKIENNMIENTSADKIKDFVLDYLHSQLSIDPYEAMAGSAKLFKDDYLSLIEKANISFYEDDQNSGVIYFKNGAVITKTVKKTIQGAMGLEVDKKTTVELHDYLNLNGYVWKNHIINADYDPIEFKGCVFDRFISLIGGKNSDKILSIKSTLGYLMHSYKTSANNKAVILNDETISENPNGGSGKGIFCAAVGHMKRLAILNGKAFDGQKSFAYQTVGADTQVLVYDDIPKNFAFENLFSVVTEGITLEKKNKDAIKLTVDKSPKIIITTNYTIGGVGGSFDRRKWEIEFSSYFSSDHTPLQEFGHLLFDDWDETEWKKFYSCMIDCYRIYLENGLVRQGFTNLAERKFIKETSFEFYEWTKEEPILVHQRMYKLDLYNKFIEEYPDYKQNKWFTQKRFGLWLETYGKYKLFKTVVGKDPIGKYVIYAPEGASQEEVKQMITPENDIIVNNEPLKF